MVRWISRLRYAWHRHGPIGMVALVAYNIAYYGRRRGRGRGIATEADPIDATYGTETAGIREVGSLQSSDLVAVRSAGRYEPSSGQIVTNALSRLGIDYRDYSFVDFGSGKGRALIIAAGFPFKSVVGVELFRELHEIARRNIAKLPPEAVRCGLIETVHADAARFEPPPHSLVCYLYDPFAGPAVSALARRLVGHCDEHGCRAIVIYVDPRYRAVFAETGRFAILDDTPPVLTMVAVPAGGVETAGRSVLRDRPASSVIANTASYRCRLADRRSSMP